MDEVLTGGMTVFPFGASELRQFRLSGHSGGAIG